MTAATSDNIPPHPVPDPNPRPATSVHITVEFTGGLEILFDNISKHHVTLPATIPFGKRPSTSIAAPASNMGLDEGAPATNTHTTTAIGTERPTVGFLIAWLLENLLKDPRRELFVVDGAVRPGILVLINDTDWELEGEDKYELKDGDNILFVSTLHGG